MTQLHPAAVDLLKDTYLPPDSIEKLAGALADAQVDLNPHQVAAALFAFKSPLSKGALLADEVGARQDHRGGTGPLAEHAQREQRQERILARISERNGAFFQQEMDKLDHWADDVRLSLRRQLKELDEEVADLRRQVRQAGTVPEKVSLHRQVNQLETKRDQAWREYDEAVRAVDR